MKTGDRIHYFDILLVTENKFGRRAYWRCVCGKEGQSPASKIEKGSKRSCGCEQFKGIRSTGKRKFPVKITRDKHEASTMAPEIYKLAFCQPWITERIESAAACVNQDKGVGK